MALTKEDLHAIGELMDKKLEPINNRLDKLEKGQARLESKVDEGFADIKSEFKYAWQDIETVERSIKRHEKEFHSA